MCDTWHEKNKIVTVIWILSASYIIKHVDCHNNKNQEHY